MLVTFLFEWNIELYAYIYRFPSPLLYLLFPTSYLYIRSVIKDETSLKKTDILHFLMSILYFIEILPHYFTSYEYRLEIVRELVSHPRRLITLNEGFLPANYHRALANNILVSDQYSVMLGTSYSFSATSKLKLELMQTHIGLASTLVDSDVQNKRLNVFSASYSVAF